VATPYLVEEGWCLCPARGLKVGESSPNAARDGCIYNREGLGGEG